MDAEGNWKKKFENRRKLFATPLSKNAPDHAAICNRKIS
jgi:hypothetical protein